MRVEPSGESVLAGRAAPGGTVRLLVDGEVAASTTADASGNFVLVPPTLPPGPHELVLEAQPEGGAPVRSVQVVSVVVAADRRQPPLVVVSAEGRPTVVVSRPDQGGAGAPAGAPAAGAPPAGAPPAAGTVTVEAIDREAGGRLHVSVRAAPGATVRLYLDGRLAGSGVAGPDGRLVLDAEGGSARSVRVRLDEVDPATGRVRARREVAFAAGSGGGGTTVASADPPGAPPATTPPGAGATPPAATPAARTPGGRPVPAPSARVPIAVPVRRTATVALAPPPVRAAPRPAATAAAHGPIPHGLRPVRRPPPVPPLVVVTVRPGESLWEISQRVYGDGERFTVIYGANSQQIIDPNVIYPGQVFRVPAGPPR